MTLTKCCRCHCCCCYCCRTQVTLGNETRLVQLTASAGYGDLLSQVATKFPNAGVCSGCGGVAQAVEERQTAAFRPAAAIIFIKV
jgi:hypothetical protein